MLAVCNYKRLLRPPHTPMLCPNPALRHHYRPNRSETLIRLTRIEPDRLGRLPLRARRSGSILNRTGTVIRWLIQCRKPTTGLSPRCSMPQRLKKGVRYLFSLTGHVCLAPDGNPVVDLHAASQPPGYHHGAPSRDTLARLPIPATAIIILSG